MVQADGSVPPEQLQVASEELLRRASELGGVNLFTLLGWQLTGRIEIDNAGGLPALQLNGFPLVLAVLCLLAGGLIFAATYYGSVAQAVREERFDFRRLMRRIPGYVLRMVLWLTLALFTGVMVGFPLLIFVGIVGLLSQTLAIGIVLLAWMGVFLIAGCLAYAPSALYLDGVGPARASLASVRIVSRFPGRSLGLIAVVWMLLTGWELVWSKVAGFPYGGVLAIAGQAYLSSGLIAAMMVYFRERSSALNRIPSTVTST